ncbi:MAG: hypothetical protein WHT06_14660 [Desulfobacterales bacterium]
MPSDDAVSSWFQERGESKPPPEEIPCPTCQGAGRRKAGALCPTCMGDGVIYAGATCPLCEGTGIDRRPLNGMDAAVCVLCDGTGEL